MIMTGLVTVAIPTFRRMEFALDALASIVAQRTSHPFEVLVMDNECNSGLQRAVEAHPGDNAERVAYHAVADRGLHECRNAAAALGRGKIIVYVDDDVICPPNWLEQLMKPFVDDNVAGVGGRTVARWEGPKPPEWLTSALDPSFFSLLDLGDADREMKLGESPYGCNMAFRRDRVVRHRGFAPDAMGGGFVEWKRGWGETGFAMSLRADGLNVFYSANGWLEHRIPASRWTPQAIERRSAKGGVSEAYTMIRRDRPSSGRLISTSIWHAYRATRALLRSWTLAAGARRIKRRVDYAFHLASSFYCARAAFDAELKRWIHRPDYWNPHSSDAEDDVAA
jgi:glycosyltransferase involved in cell wall biosynthesis